MTGIDYLILAIVAICVIAAILYIRKEKKRGVKCIGCPSAGTCGQKSNGGCTCNTDKTL